MGCLSSQKKLDGSGYLFHCPATELSAGARILMVADIFTALAEDRPYRGQISWEEIVRILKEFSDRGLLDIAVVNFVLSILRNSSPICLKRA